MFVAALIIKTVSGVPLSCCCCFFKLRCVSNKVLYKTDPRPRLSISESAVAASLLLPPSLPTNLSGAARSTPRHLSVHSVAPSLPLCLSLSLAFSPSTSHPGQLQPSFPPHDEPLEAITTSLMSRLLGGAALPHAGSEPPPSPPPPAQREQQRR